MGRFMGSFNNGAEQMKTINELIEESASVQYVTRFHYVNILQILETDNRPSKYDLSIINTISQMKGREYFSTVGHNKILEFYKNRKI